MRLCAEKSAVCRSEDQRSQEAGKVGIFFGCLGLAVLLAWFFFPWQNSRAVGLAAPGVEEFLDWFWERPLAKQETARIFPHRICDPLAPETCRVCHGTQYDDWSGSRHAMAMGPGAIGQFFDMDRERWQACLDCHAPLFEQSENLAGYLDGPQGDKIGDGPLPDFAHRAGERLQERGVICAVCHVRADRWYGPARHEESFVPQVSDSLPHRGWISVDAFGDSLFCAACHQFPPNSLSLNGKPMENTYEEWRASPQARQGIGCQDCHMPDRRHFFRGIHDPETVSAGVAVGSRSFSVSGSEVTVSVFLTNTGTGHRLPTYVTPEIRLEVYQQDAHGARIPDTKQVEQVMRKVDLQITTEYFDTRLLPGQTATLTYKKTVSPRAHRLVARVYVEPDAFYTRIYEALLEMELEEQGAELIREALAESRRSGFALYERHYPLQGP
ncbi:MAG: Cytochrome c554 and c-prime [Candidatus Kentron sp. G]|nr:MAG: Cytochrome c554 and c-prime [Candidatus Kentron sp. G]VFM98329.1 MAG: Cytochrome c554 and c-prime [Candidatus Kentron sp. G]